MKKILFFTSTFVILSNILLADYNEGNLNNISLESQNEFKWNDDLKLNLTNVGNNWVGIGPNGEKENTSLLKYTRIPSMIITNDNKLVVMFDLRWNGGNDQNRIDTGIAISKDGGFNWNKKTIISYNDSVDSRRRIMDSTMLYDPIDDAIYSLHGAWKDGTSNWYANRIDYYDRNSWSGIIHKSIDGGETFNRLIEISKNENSDIYSQTMNEVNPIVGFLGGVGTGIVMKNGNLVFPIQTAHKDRKDPYISFTIMYSKDRGKTWEMPKTQQYIQPNTSSLENMVFEIEDNKLVITGRGNSRWAYISDDMGITWKEFEPMSGFSGTTGAPSQGSSIYVTLPSGRKVILVSKPNGNNDGYKRGNLALWMLDGINKEHKKEITIVRPGSGNAEGAGYSSLAYKDGKLFIAYEDDGNITVENLSKFIGIIEETALSWGLENLRVKDLEKIDNLKNLNVSQKNFIKENIEKGNDNYIVIANVLDREIGEFKDLINKNDKEILNKENTPSKLNEYNAKVKFLNENILNEQGLNFGIKDINIFKEEINKLFSNLEMRIKLENYLKEYDKYEYTDKTIVDNFSKNIYFELGIKYYDKLGSSLKLGFNKNINKNLSLGSFFEYSNGKAKNYSIGTNLRYKNNDNIVNSFVRYRNLNEKDLLDCNHNIDMYIDYNRVIKVHDNVKIIPKVSLNTTYSTKSKVNEDIVLNQRFDISAGISTKFIYENKKYDLSMFIEPELNLNKNDKEFYQLNKVDNKYKVDNKSLGYKVKFEIEKRLEDKIQLGANINVSGYFDNKVDILANFKLSYNW